MPASADDPPSGATTGMPSPDEPATTTAGGPDPIADVREELSSTLDHWTPPDGMDPAEAEALRAQMQQLVDDYQPAPGETPADATEALLGQIQQEMADYADAHDGVDPGSIDVPAGPDPLADVREELSSTLDAWTPPEGMDPAEAEALRTQMQQLVDDYQPAPGETPADATEILLGQIQQQMANYADANDGTDPGMTDMPGAGAGVLDPAANIEALRSEIAELDPANPYDADRIDELEARIDAMQGAQPATPADDQPADNDVDNGVDTGVGTGGESHLADAFDMVGPQGDAPQDMSDPTYLATDSFPDTPDDADDPLGVASVYAAAGGPPAELSDAMDTPADLPSVPGLPGVDDLPSWAEEAADVAPDLEMPAVPDVPEVIYADDTMDDDPLGAGTFDDDNDTDFSQP
jgi:hypothetical protein